MKELKRRTLNTILASRHYNRRDRRTIIRAMITIPAPLLGRAPHFLLWGQVGNVPINTRMATTKSITPASNSAPRAAYDRPDYLKSNNHSSIQWESAVGCYFANFVSNNKCNSVRIIRR